MNELVRLPPTIRELHYDLIRALEREWDRHQHTVEMLGNQVKELQGKCPHPQERLLYQRYSSNSEDSWLECLDCGKEV